MSQEHKGRMKLTLLALALWLWAVPCSFAAGKPMPPRIDVILWFDTEDYLLLADDDACLRLANMLTERKIRATFKMVGEKARVLEQRGRKDVIKALRQHDIGYHSDFHSVHPTPTEYLADCGWLDGVAEFARREGDGAADVRRIFRVKTLSCYGQPGSSWGPQTLAALKDIGVAPDGIPCYVDEGQHVGYNQKPFWYAGALNVFNMGRGRGYTRMDLHDPAALEPAKKEVGAMVQRLGERVGGGLISIFYHPCEWVHQQFWDGVNFSRGANPPREDWKAPGQLTAEQTEGALARFALYVDHIRSLPGVRFVTASDLPGIYADSLRRDGATAEEMSELVQRIASGLDVQVIGGTAFSVTDQFERQFLLHAEPGGKAFSVADQFELFTEAVAQRIEGKAVKFPVAARGLIGPDTAPPTNTLTQIPWPAFRDTVLDVRDYIRTHRRVPPRVFFGTEAIAPADFLVALANVYSATSPIAEVALPQNTPILTMRHVATDTPKLFGGWVIHKEGFRAPKLMELARLQAWSLKPALRKE